MALVTSNGNELHILGIAQDIRETLLQSMFGLNTKVTTSNNTLVYQYPTLGINMSECWVGISKTCPNSKGAGFIEPTDKNYRRFLLVQCQKVQGDPIKSQSVYFVKDSEDEDGYLINKAENKITEIKFNRSTEPEKWQDEHNNPEEYRYFCIFKRDVRLNEDGVPIPGSDNETAVCWGYMAEPITVDRINVVPLFEDGKFRVYLPSPNDAEAIADAAAEDDDRAPGYTVTARS